MRDDSPKKLAGAIEKEDQAKQNALQVRSGRIRIPNWRQRGLVFLSGILCAFTALYVYAPNVAKAFPSQADWVFSYVFLVNDGRQALSEILQSWDQFLVSLDIAGNAASAKNWVVGTVQKMIDFGLGLIGNQEAVDKG